MRTRPLFGLDPAVKFLYAANADEGFGPPEQRGGYLCVGFGSVWMMNDRNLTRIALADNAVTEIPIDGATGRWRRIAVGEGAV